MTVELDRVTIFRDDENCPGLPIVERGGSARAVIWPGVGAVLRSMHRISLQRGGRTVELEHPSEAVYYLIEGSAAALDLSGGARHSLATGSMAHIDPGTRYVFEAGAEGAEIIGGPCPADRRLYTHLEEG